MKAGPELDALVAEKVLGWRWRRSAVTGRRCLYPLDRYPEWMEAEADGSEDIVRDVAEGMVPLLPISTDLTTCAAAAEEARKAGKIAAWTVSAVSTSRYASFVLGGATDVGEEGESPAHALALALLKACGGEV